MKNLDLFRVAACFIIFLIISTLLEQFTPLSTGTSLGVTLVQNILVGAFVTGVLLYIGAFDRDSRRMR